MRKVADVLFDRDSKFKINIPTLIMIIASTATVVSSVYAVKVNIDLSINSIQENQIRIEEKFDQAVWDLEEKDKESHARDTEIISVQKEDRAVVLEVRTAIAGIQTDLKWLIADTKSRQ